MIQMKTEEAIKIILTEMQKNSFTMGMDLDEYVLEFRKRYAKMFGKILPNGNNVYIAVAKEIKRMNKFKNINKVN